MKNILESTFEWESKLHGQPVMLFLDFDGTLAPIAETPEAAVLPMETKFLVARLAAWPHCTVAIVSGRSLVDLESKVALKRVIYAGNHGLEITGLKQPFGSPVPPVSQEAIRSITASLRTKLANIPGSWVEDKGLTSTIHYRQVATDQQAAVVAAVRDAAAVFVEQGKVVIREGKSIAEVRPAVRWGKGEAVASILDTMPKGTLAIYIGDDATDEDAFKALQYRGMSVAVGNKPSLAEYFVPDTAGVVTFLSQLLRTIDKLG